jgi:hypothetical protein
MTKSGVYFDRRLKCFVSKLNTKLIRYRGVRTTLQSKFFPHYDYKRCTLNSNEPQALLHQYSSSQHQLRSSLKNHKNKPVRDAFNSKMGLRVGVNVDNQIKASIKLSKKYDHPIPYMCQHTSGYVKQFWCLMNRMKLKPIDAQVPVWNESLRIATACDVVCYHIETNQYQILEIKTGHQNYYFKCSPTSMRAPFQHQTDCVFNQNQLQLWLTHTLYQQTYPQRKLLGPMIVRMHSKGVDTYSLTDWIHRNAVEAFKQLLN